MVIVVETSLVVACSLARANTIPCCWRSTPTLDEADGKQVPLSGHRGGRKV
jgi:hypothetical protein